MTHCRGRQSSPNCSVAVGLAKTTRKLKLPKLSEPNLLQFPPHSLVKYLASYFQCSISVEMAKILCTSKSWRDIGSVIIFRDGVAVLEVRTEASVEVTAIISPNF